MRRLIPIAAASALAATLAIAPATGMAAAVAPEAAAKPKPGKTPSPYAFRASGFGTRIKGGDLPTTSGRTAYESIGCTNLAGIHRHNEVADVQIPGLGKVSGIATDLTTEQNSQGTSTVSRHSIARVVLAESSFGRLSIKGVDSYARATATARGYDTETKTSLAKLVFEPTGGQPQELDLPTPGQPIVVPGVLRVAIGDSFERKQADSAKAVADGLSIKLIPTNTLIQVAHTSATITKGIKTGLFAGSANTSATTLLGEIAGTGRTQLVQMPCQGTKGKVRVNDAVGIKLPGILDVGAATARQMGVQGKKKAVGFEEASVASIDLGDGALKIDAIKGRVSVERAKGKGKKPKVSFAGSQVAGITVDGETYTLPELDGLEIPGLAKIETLVKEKLKNGGRITALRLTLLDGSGAVVNLGQANLRIYSSRR